MFKIDMTDIAKAHIGSDCIAHTDLQKGTIKVEPLAHHINCETTGIILGYRDSVKMDAPVWKKFYMQRTWMPIPGLEITCRK